MQTRLQSLLESCINVAIGYGVALLGQLIVFPLYGMQVSLETNLHIGAWFTAISIARSYMVRRAFNWYHKHPPGIVSGDCTDLVTPHREGDSGRVY